MKGVLCHETFFYLPFHPLMSVLCLFFFPQTYSQSLISGKVQERKSLALPIANVLLLAATITLSYRLPIKTYFTTSYMMDSEQARSARGALDLGLQKKLTRKGGRMSLSLIDVFDSADWMDYNFLQKEYSVPTYGIFQFSQRYLRLSYSHLLATRK
jgi:hypothetical protein